MECRPVRCFLRGGSEQVIRALQFRAREAGFRHTHNLQGDAADLNGTSEDRGVRSKKTVPCPIAEDADRVRAVGTVVRFVQQAAQRRARAEEAEESAGNQLQRGGPLSTIEIDLHA